MVIIRAKAAIVKAGCFFLPSSGVFLVTKVFVYLRGDSKWGLEQTLEHAGEMPCHHFGYSLSIDGDVATVRGIPEPATLPMICLGIWVLLVAPRVRR